MSEVQSEMRKREVLRLSNEESNKLTRECIETALIILMSEKDYHAITISEIVKRAGVSRTAYYRNYQSKEDILKNLLYTVISNVNEGMKKFSYVTEQRKYWKTLFVITKSHAEPFRILLEAGFGGTILEEITKLVTCGTNDSVEKNYDLIFWSGAVYNVLVNWVQNGMKQTEDEMVEICLYVLADFNRE